MGTNYLPIFLVIISQVFYHLLLKLTPSSVNPIVSLAVTYLTAMLVCIIIYPFFKGNGSEENILMHIKQLNWTSISLGVSIIGLELGFLLAYRDEWNLGITGIICVSTATLLLVPIGIFLFKESITIKSLIGVLLCISGLVLINSK